MLLPQATQAAVTQRRGLGAYEPHTFALHSSGGCRLHARWEPLLGHGQCLLAGSSRQKGQEALSGLCLKDADPAHEGPTLMTSSP